MYRSLFKNWAGYTTGTTASKISDLNDLVLLPFGLRLNLQVSNKKPGRNDNLQHCSTPQLQDLPEGSTCNKTAAPLKTPLGLGRKMKREPWQGEEAATFIADLCELFGCPMGAERN